MKTHTEQFDCKLPSTPMHGDIYTCPVCGTIWEAEVNWESIGNVESETELNEEVSRANWRAAGRQLGQLMAEQEGKKLREAKVKK